MRSGFTTGSCAAAAAKAAAYMLFSGKSKEKISVMTPKGIMFDAELVNITRSETQVSCGVIKDGGDDPDITTGSVVMVTVSFGEGNDGKINVDGGVGVGRVTRPGLDQPVGNAAINSVPRQMIVSEVRNVLELFDESRDIDVIVSVPDGQEKAEKTFNPRLGIEGGISILGTSGIVEPMSTQAIIDTIRVELKQRRELGEEIIALAPGNYGLEFMESQYGYDLDRAVKISNFVGVAIDEAVKLGFRGILLIGHIGKLVKLSGGIMNTHSKEADCRMELLASAAVKSGLEMDVIARILDCLTTEEALELVARDGKIDDLMGIIMDRIDMYLQKRAGENVKVGCITFSNVMGILGETSQAAELLKELDR